MTKRSLSTLRVSWILLVALALLNGAALWSIFATRDGARGAARHDLELRTTVLARTVQAELASLRADFLFLAHSPPVTGLAAADTNFDALQRRWRRLDAEGTLLLYLEAHPEVRRLSVEGPGGRGLVVVGWRGGAQTLFPPESPPPISPEWFSGRWPIDPGRTDGPWLAAWIEPRRLLLGAVPDAAGLRLETAPDPTTSPADDQALSATVPIVDDDWQPPVSWRLTAREPEGRLLRSVEALTGLYGTTVGLNVTVMSLGLVLGLVAFRNLRRAVTLEAEREHEVRMRELERQLAHSERLASLGRIAAGLAHEINNPLEGVSNYLALVDDDLSHGRLEAGREGLARAREGVGRAAEVIREVLAYSEPAREATVEVDLRETVSRSVEFLRSRRDHREVSIDLDLPAGAVPVEGNPITLGQVFLNLLLNAAEACGRITVRAVSADGWAEVRVADRGAGISEADLGRIFEPFYSTRESTGLGLSISRSIVETHGGSIEARNRARGGAEFIVRLPSMKRSGDVR